MHVPLKSQEDFIAAVVETRKNSDILKDKLKKNDYQKINLELDENNKIGYLSKMKKLWK